MTKNELDAVLKKHKEWLSHEEGGERAVLQGANLRWAALQGAVLQGANLDYSCWPLWCGSLYANIDDRIARQLLFHLMCPCLVSPNVSDEFRAALFTPELIAQANLFHRVDECGKIIIPAEGALE